MRNPIARVIRGIRPQIIADKRGAVLQHILEEEAEAESNLVRVIRSGASDDEIKVATMIYDAARMQSVPLKKP